MWRERLLNWKRVGRLAWPGLCAAWLVFGPGAGLADDSHDRARQALESGQILPLRTVLERVERDYPGQVLDVELEREQGDGSARERWIYELKLLRSAGSLVKLKVDARDGRVIDSKERRLRQGKED